MKAIIIAAGQATRWNNHLGVPKHFAPVDGEPILHRTVRLLCERGVRDINIIAKPGDNRYLIPDTVTHTPKTRLDFGDADKFLSSRDLWDTDGRTTIGRWDVTQHVIGSNLVAIDDWTDDFDYPHDYDQFTARRRAYTPIDPFDE